MTSPEDWVIKKDVQLLIQDFAVLHWKITNEKLAVDKLKKEVEEMEDCQSEFDLKGSWMEVGECYLLINDETEDVMNELLTERKEEKEERLKTCETLLKELEKESAGVKSQIIAALGDKVQLNF